MGLTKEEKLALEEWIRQRDIDRRAETERLKGTKPNPKFATPIGFKEDGTPFTEEDVRRNNEILYGRNKKCKSKK